MYFGPLPRYPTSDDPADYPRSTKITDDDAAMLIVTLERINERRNDVRRQMLDLSEQDSILHAEFTLAHAKLFQRLRQLHPDVCADGEHGWRKFDDAYWLVGW